MKISVFNQKGEEVGKELLPKEIFEVRVNPDLIHQVVVSFLANQRQKIAHTEDRGEVRGGGKKPWRQKGTGRARAGSIRSPLWKGGGITFGPRKEKVFKKIIPKKIKRKALFMVLSAKAKKDLLTLVDTLEIEKGKTREIFEILKKLPCKDKSTLIALPEYDKKIIQASRNMPHVKVMEAKELNALALLSFKYILLPKNALKVIKETFSKKD